VIYRAFLIDVLARQRRASRRGATATPLDEWLRAAWRAAAEDRGACAAAGSLLVELGLGTQAA